MTTPDRDGCLSADTLAMAARGELPPAERDRVADHLAACADCAEELQLIQPLEAWSERTAAAYGRAPVPVPEPWRWLPVWQLAATVLLLASVGVLIWNFRLRQSNDELMARASVPPSVPAAAPPATEPLIRADVNVPIVDLQTDVFRSGTGGLVPTVPASASLATLILATDLRDASGVYQLSIVDANARTVWESAALKMTEFNTFTVAVSPRDLGAGLYRLELARPASAGALHVYQLRIAPEATAR
jgi:hypothetical protein